MGSCGREEVDGSGQMWVGIKALVEVCVWGGRGDM